MAALPTFGSGAGEQHRQLTGMDGQRLTGEAGMNGSVVYVGSALLLEVAMKAGLIAFHYPHPEYEAEMISRVRRAAQVMAATPGCLAAECWVSQDDRAVVTTGQWDSEPALAASFAAVRAAGVDFDYDERESRPRQMVRLAPA